jgi:hypothetical protein
MVLLIAFRLLAGRPATTAMEHRGGQDNGDAPSSWLPGASPTLWVNDIL